MSGTLAVVPLGALAAMLAILVAEAVPAIRYNGWRFFTSSAWNPGNAYAPVVRAPVPHPPGARYGAWPLIAGTLESSAIALAVALPVALGAAILVVEKLPRRAGAAIGWCLETLAGVPSAVIGLWGVLVFGPFLAAHVYPALQHVPDVPVLGVLRGSFNPAGQGLLTGGLVLAAMIVPIIAATTRDLLRQVPVAAKEGAVALGMTDAEAFRAVQARWIRTGVIGAAALGLGRALGETIAIALVSGSSFGLATSLYGSMTTIAATIVTQLDSAQADPSGLAVRTLAEAALVLFAITLAVNVAARLLTRRAGRGLALPVGAVA
ncbi:MAG TPA: phosphate ABC transporter permease subunit PstC [Acidimicrobiales bacterium]|nr:phosphate ABC transporter permease subunit PstC [Acidimicrobiales bacterium]